MNFSTRSSYETHDITSKFSPDSISTSSRMRICVNDVRVYIIVATKFPSPCHRNIRLRKEAQRPIKRFYCFRNKISTIHSVHSYSPAVSRLIEGKCKSLQRQRTKSEKRYELYREK